MTTTPISEYAMNGLAQHLKTKHHLTDDQAVKRAEWIMKRKAEDAGKKRAKLESAQLLIPLDADGPTEEPVSKYQPTEDVPF